MMSNTVAEYSIEELAKIVDGRVEGDAHRLILGVSSLNHANKEQLSFLSNRRYKSALKTTNAGVVLVAHDEEVHDGRTVIRCSDPYVAFAKILRLWSPSKNLAPGIHPMAVVSDTAIIDPSVHIEPFVFIGHFAQIGLGTIIESGVRIGDSAVVGIGCHIKANAVVGEGCVLGDRVLLQPGSIIGSDGFGFAPDEDKLHKIPQVGIVRIGDDVELGAHTCVDRPAFGETQVHKGVKTDNFVQIGHAAEIGEHSLLVAYSGVAGSTQLGKRNVLAAKAAVLGHLILGDGVQVGAGSIVHNHQADGAKVTGYPAIEHHKWLRQCAVMRRLPKTLKKVDERIQGMLAPTNEHLQLLPHRYPFVFLDRILELNPQVNGTGVKCVSLTEPFFQGHFPDNPIFPGVLQIECMAQLVGAVAIGRALKDGEIIFLAGVEKARFFHPIYPGMKLDVRCAMKRKIKDLYIFDASIWVDEEKMSSARIQVAHQNPASIQD